MSLVRLIYASKIKDGHGPNDIMKIVEVSEKNNQRKGITGALCFGPRHFLQCLEGNRDEINRLYNKIVTDGRHTDVALLYYSDICERVFGDWAMGYVLAEKSLHDIVFRFSGSRTFNPYDFTGTQAVRFLQAVVKERQEALASEADQTHIQS